MHRGPTQLPVPSVLPSAFATPLKQNLIVKPKPKQRKNLIVEAVVWLSESRLTLYFSPSAL